jgi:hypothetical protein
MLTDDQLAARIGPRLHAELADLPVPDLATALRHRQARQARRTRVTVALTTLPVAAAAFAAAVFLPGSAAQKGTLNTTQNTAYVLTRVTRALTAVPAGTIMFSRQTWGINASVVYRWDNGTRDRTEVFTHVGRLETDGGNVLKGRTLTGIVIDYGSRTWERWSFTKDAADNLIPSCAHWPVIMVGSGNTGETAAWLHDAVSCGVLTAAGTASVDGVTAIKLTGTIGINSPATMTYYVNPTTYLPVRLVLGHSLQADFQWLPPTTANLAKLALPTPPAGFTQVRG